MLRWSWKGDIGIGKTWTPECVMTLKVVCLRRVEALLTVPPEVLEWVRAASRL